MSKFRRLASSKLKRLYRRPSNHLSLSNDFEAKILVFEAVQALSELS
jgi:hypothetical protein